MLLDKAHNRSLLAGSPPKHSDIEEARLGGRVVKDPRGGLVSLNGADIDDVAAPLLFKVPDRPLRQREHSQNVDSESVLKAGPRDIRKGIQ